MAWVILVFSYLNIYRIVYLAVRNPAKSRTCCALLREMIWSALFESKRLSTSTCTTIHIIHYTLLGWHIFKKVQLMHNDFQKQSLNAPGSDPIRLGHSLSRKKGSLIAEGRSFVGSIALLPTFEPSTNFDLWRSWATFAQGVSIKCR